MGCVRDLIKPTHFTKQIVKFHEETRATVEVISYNQNAQRVLWMGLTHSKFVVTLRKLIAEELLQQESQASFQSPAATNNLLPFQESTQHQTVSQPSSPQKSSFSAQCFSRSKSCENINLESKRTPAIQPDTIPIRSHIRKISSENVTGTSVDLN